MAKGFKHGSGGSNPLNFKVICNPKPENARENTIWVDTDRINNYYFSATQPENMEEYDVWFPIGTSSPVGFNAVKKNGIQVYPISAKQYVGVEWVEKTAKSYQGGEWVDWFTYLYKQGHKFESITGGWSGFVYYEDYDPGIYTERESSILVQSNTNHICGGCGPEKKIDLTDVSKIVVNFVDTNRNITVFVSSVRSGQSYAQRVSAVDFDGGSGEVVLDVSALVGSYYLIMGFVDYYASNWYYEFDEVRLE